MAVDLHAHTNASDGSLSPEGLVHRAIGKGLTALAITDHDSVEAITAALRAAEGSSLLVIPGVELSAVYENLDVHVLGYFVDYTDPSFLARLEELRAARLERAANMVEALHEAGFDVTIEEVLRLAEEGAVGRSHVARALVNKGHAPNVAKAFDLYIGRGRPYYVPKPSTTPARAVSTILDAGGVPVLAHPAITGVESLIPQLARVGLAGVEAYHAEHTQEQAASLVQIAREHGLIVTGGSDHHGPTSPGGDLGSADIPDYVLPELLARAGLTHEPAQP